MVSVKSINEEVDSLLKIKSTKKMRIHLSKRGSHDSVKSDSVETWEEHGVIPIPIN